MTVAYATPPKPIRSTNVLLIDDDDGDRLLVRRLLQGSRLDIEVAEATKGSEGLEFYGERGFDCVILDYCLPDTSGDRVLQLLLDCDEAASVIVLTGWHRDSLAVEMVEAGAVDTLSKNELSPAKLERAIEYAVARRRFRKAEAASEQKDRFLSHVSHELRTPLAAIHDFVSLILDGIGGDANAQHKELLAIALKNTRKLGRMIENLLEVTRSEAGKLPIDARPTGVEEVIGYTVSALEPLALSNGLMLDHHIAPDLPPVLADPDRVDQILTNLLENALKFTLSGGKVRVEACRCPDDEHFVCVGVHDTGLGIPPDQAEKIFDQLYQAESTLDVSRKGLGLGLYISRDLVTRHRGRIWVESTLGKGSSFFFTLPIYSLATQTAPILSEANLATTELSIVVTKVSRPDGLPITGQVRHSLDELGGIIQACLLPDKDVLLPRRNDPGKSEYRVAIAWTGEEGAQILAKRIESQAKKHEDLVNGDLAITTQVVGPIESLRALGRPPTAPETVAAIEATLATELWRYRDEQPEDPLG